MVFQHYLSYGSTDQVTARDLTALYNGLLVPGTVAAYQSEGTKGFVLTLSAAESKEYIIDPRFPLFQNQLPEKPKKSHVSLANVLGDSTLVSTGVEPRPSGFDDTRCQTIARSWVEFNTGYTSVSSKHFAKYAKRLGKAVVSDKKQLPRAILAPYVMASDTSDAWWSVSQTLFEKTVEAARVGSVPVIRVVAAKSPGGLDELLANVKDKDVCVWVDNLDELNSPIEDLVTYGQAIRNASVREQRTFALYGGYFSVALGQFGLGGSSHGIGYGEYRRWRELPSSGPPPARFYVLRLHRYLSTDLAQILWSAAPELINSPVYSGSPAALDYQELMAHSVECRQAEITETGTLTPEQIVQDLQEINTEFSTTIGSIRLPTELRRKARDMHAHLPKWAAAIDTIAT